MAQNRARPGIKHIQIFHVGMAGCKQKPRKQYRQYTLEHIAGKNDQAGFGAQHAERIGGSCVPASVIPDINAMHFAIDK